jgi:hypothetical protein
MSDKNFESGLTEGVGEEFEAGYRLAEILPAAWQEACRSPMLREMIWPLVRLGGNRRADETAARLPAKISNRPL